MSTSRLAILAALVLIVPACGGNVSVPAPLLSETFTSAFPDSNWTAATTTGSGTAPVTTTGVLAFTATAQPSSSKTTTTSAFTNPNVTLQVQMAAQATAGMQGIGTIEILDGGNNVVAFVSWDVGAGTIDYSIAGSLLAPPVSPPANDGTFTTFRFSVDTMGTATWSHNNVGVATHPSFTAGPLKLRLGATWSGGTTFAEFDFDNVSVTSP